MKIAITGGAGFIGSHLATAYLEAGHDIIIIDNLTYGTHQQEALDERARFYHVDIRDQKARSILHHERPDIVSYHVAQTREVDHQGHTLTHADVHVRGLLNILDGCVDAGVKKFIFASGGNDLYARTGDYQEIPLHEEHALCPDSAQDISKVAGEWYVRYYTRQHRIIHSILRYADVYGETPLYAQDQQRQPHPLTTMITALAKQQRPILRGNTSAIRDHIFIDDVVNANIALLQRGENQTFHVSSGQGHSIDQLYRLTARTMESTLEPIYVPCNAIDSSNATTILDNSRANKQLGWQPEIAITTGVHMAIHRLHAKKFTVERNTDKLEIIAAEPTLTHA